MKKHSYLFLFIISLSFFSCGSDAIPTPITFVFDNPIPEGTYPDYFKNITEPFSVESCDTDYLLKPINVARLDIKKAPVEINAWYFEKMGDNTVEFSKNWLFQYFKDSLVDPYLTKPTKRKVPKNVIDSYLKKEDILTIIYSEESDLETYKDQLILSSAKEVNTFIKENICNTNLKEIVVLVNPYEVASILPPALPLEELETIKDPCSLQTITDGLALKEDLLKIIDTSKSYKERDQIAREVWKKYFDEMAEIKMYLNPTDKYPDMWESGDGANYFIDRLAYKNSITDINITRIENHRDTDKITSMTVVECHNASEIQ